MTCRFEETLGTRRVRFPVHAPRRGLLLLIAASLLGAVACGDDDSGPVLLQVTSPRHGQVLTLEDDDTDPDRAGLQFDVTVSTAGLSLGTTLNLFIDGEQRDNSGRVNVQGNVTMPDVTLPPGRHTIHVETTTGSASSDPEHEYLLRGIEIVSPRDGASLTSADDTDDDAAGVQIDVSVATFGVDRDEDVVLLLDGEPAASPAMPDEEGDVSFRRIDVSNGSHTLQARAGEGALAVLSTEVDIQVSDSCPSITFLTPRPPGGGESTLTLGGDDQCPSGDDPFTTEVTIGTNAADGVTVRLLVNDQQVADGTVTRSAVTFEDVPLGGRSRGNELKVQLDTPEGVRCEESFPANVLVDCAGVDCRIAGPVPVEFTDDDGDSALYLNAALRGGDGFEITVESNAEIDGRDVELIIDGNTRRPLRAPAQADDDVALARFGDLALSEGAHTFEALCRDAQGNVTSSGELTWIVDVTACEVELTSPGAGIVLVPADDEDGATTGTQIVLSATVSGADCVSERAAPCDPDDGIAGTDFGSYDGTSPLLSPVTLDDAVISQSLCLEIADRAGNVARDSVAVEYRGSAPLVMIESPADGARYNVLGGGQYTADADPTGSPTACDAAFSIACSELGVDVELFRDGAATPFVTAPCEEPGAGDPALPSGYAGRAQVTALFDDGDGSAMIIARQTVEGSSSRELVGSSDAITLQGDCRAPSAFFTGDPCKASTFNQLTLAEAAARDFGVAESSADTASVVATISNTDGTMATLAPSATTPASPPFSSATWADVDLGGVGMVTIAAELRDDFDNVAELECTGRVVDDLPAIVTFTQPVDGAVFRPADDCDPGTPAVFDVRVVATIDQQTDRVASVLVNDVDVTGNLAIDASGGIDVCVPVPDNVTHQGASTVELHVESTVGTPPGFAEETRTVHVVLAGPTQGITIDDLLPPDHDDAEHRAGVVATWAEPMQDYPGQLVSYEMRCAAAPPAALDQATTDAWWTAATPVDLGGLTPDDDPEVTLAFRPEEPNHCVLRAADVAGLLTPITSSTDLTLKFRQVVLATANTNVQLGARVAPVGDVDGDGFDDVLVGGVGRAELIFGTDGDPATARKVVFVGTGNGVGRSVAALGDFNDDGVHDFAVSDPAWNSFAGRVSVFFGRPQSAWPAMMNIEDSCSADLCLEGSDGFIGRTLASAGDFDDDGTPDLAIGSPFYPSLSSPDGQLLIVLGASYENRSCGSETDCRASEDCVASVCQLAGGTFWQLRFNVQTGESVDPPPGPAVPRLAGFRLDSNGALGGLGTAVVSLGEFDAFDGDDLVVSSPTLRQVHFLSGRSHSGTPGLDALDAADLGLRDDMGDPSGTPIATHATANAFGFNLGAVGDLYEAPGAAVTGTVDLAIGTSLTDVMYVAVGDPLAADDPGFASPLIGVSGPAGSEVGYSIATGLDVVLGTIGDLDDDGRPDLLAGTAGPGSMVLWYADDFASAALGGSVTTSSGISIPLEARTPQTDELAVGYAGDFNGDGHPDVVVGDSTVGTNQGQVVLLY